MLLRHIGGITTDVPVIFKSLGAHFRFRRVNGYLDHVLRPWDKVRVGVNVTINRAFEQLILYTRTNLELSGLSLSIW
jgi:hypothetical protein